MTDKEKALHEWAQGNPFLTDYLMFDFLREHQGSCAIAPISGESALKRYINGDAMKVYRFALQVSFALSDSTDDTNTQNMFTLRQWQHWLEEQERLRQYPNFGESCGDYQIRNLSNTPQMAMRYENGMAKYQFFAEIKYLERGTAE
jgi:hypothetical protein